MLDTKVTPQFADVLDDFRTFLTERGITSEAAINHNDIQDYVLARRETHDDVMYLITAIKEYFIAVKNDVLSNEFWLFEGGIWHFEQLSEHTKRELGDDVWEQVFADMPKTGATVDEITNFARKMQEKLSKVAPKEQIECLVQKHAHGSRPIHNETHRKILETKGIDALLEHLQNEFIKECEQAMLNDEEIFDYFKANPHCVRTGNKIINKQLPNFIKKYLHETDIKLKRYYGCHCEWKRKSILQDEGSLSGSLCYCCMAHCRHIFDAAFGQELKGRVVKSRMDDSEIECIFEYDIPKEWLDRV